MRCDLWHTEKFTKFVFLATIFFQNITKIKVLGVKEQQEMQNMLEPEQGMDMIEGEPERKRLALMGASSGALGVAAPPGMPV